MRLILSPIGLLLLPLTLCLSACVNLPSENSQEGQTAAFKLPPLPLPRDSVEVDIVLIDRPIGDPLLGKLLWREVDQVGTLSSEQRAALREAGMLVGHVGSSPPAAVQSLLNLADEEAERRRREANGIPQTTARRVALPPGGDTEITASEPVLHRAVSLPDGRQTELENVHGLLRLRAERSQDGWARLEFLPEIHHGQTKTRPFAAATGWMYRTAQEVIPCFAQSFAANLNVGEMLIVTADRDRPESLGQNLFQFEDSTGVKQRIVIVRVSDLREISPTRSAP